MLDYAPIEKTSDAIARLKETKTLLSGFKALVSDSKLSLVEIKDPLTVAMDCDHTISHVDAKSIAKLTPEATAFLSPKNKPIVCKGEWPVVIYKPLLTKLVFTFIAKKGRRVVNVSNRVMFLPGTPERKNMDEAYDLAYENKRDFLQFEVTEEIRAEWHKSPKTKVCKNDLLAVIKRLYAESVILVDDTKAICTEAEKAYHFAVHVTRDADDPYKDFQFLFELICQLFPLASFAELKSQLEEHGELEKFEKEVISEFITDLERFMREKKSLMELNIKALHLEKNSPDKKMQACFFLLRNFRSIPFSERESIGELINNFIKEQLLAKFSETMTLIDKYDPLKGLSLDSISSEDFQFLHDLGHLINLAYMHGFENMLSISPIYEIVEFTTHQLLINSVKIFAEVGSKLDEAFSQCLDRLHSLIRLWEKSPIPGKKRMGLMLRQTLSDPDHKIFIMNHLLHHQENLNFPVITATDLYKAYLHYPLLEIPFTKRKKSIKEIGDQFSQFKFEPDEKGNFSETAKALAAKWFGFLPVAKPSTGEGSSPRIAVTTAAAAP